MTHYKIPFNKPSTTGREFEYMQQALKFGQLSGNGHYTQLCHKFFRERYGFAKTLLTTSCTDALEMSALLLDILPGDEVILPSYTFVSTANAFALRGAKLQFVDCCSKTPHMDVDALEPLITKRTKAIVPVHYGGVACAMDELLALADHYEVSVIEDAAQAVDAYYKKTPLGALGTLAAFSFHETKNISSGEGGMLVVNKPKLESRAEVMWEKGTNRAAYFRGEVDKYTWIDLGSSFLPSELTSAYLMAQLESIDLLQHRRKELWSCYYQELADLERLEKVQLPYVPDYSQHNAHLFYIVCKSLGQRIAVQQKLSEKGILAVSHYVPLHSSPFYIKQYQGEVLPRCDMYAECLLRLPLYPGLTNAEQAYVIENVRIALSHVPQ
jgi:dTDP-4-amino-4,6-dideoxygalactose transaminase